VVKCSGVLQCSDGLSNKMSNIIKRLHIVHKDNMKLLLICILRVLLSQTFIFFRLCFFLSCKANVRVKPAKTGHGPHSS